MEGAAAVQQSWELGIASVSDMHVTLMGLRGQYLWKLTSRCVDNVREATGLNEGIVRKGTLAGKIERPGEMHWAWVLSRRFQIRLWACGEREERRGVGADAGKEEARLSLLLLLFVLECPPTCLCWAPCMLSGQSQDMLGQVRTAHAYALQCGSR